MKRVRRIVSVTVIALALAGAHAPSAGAKSCRITLRSPVVEPMPIVVDLCPAD